MRIYGENTREYGGSKKILHTMPIKFNHVVTNNRLTWHRYNDNCKTIEKYVVCGRVSVYDIWMVSFKFILFTLYKSPTLQTTLGKCIYRLYSISKWVLSANPTEATSTSTYSFPIILLTIQNDDWGRN